MRAFGHPQRRVDPPPVDEQISMCIRRASVLSQLWVFSNLRYAENRSESRQAVELLQVCKPTIRSESRTDNEFGLAATISRLRTMNFDKLLPRQKLQIMHVPRSRVPSNPKPQIAPWPTNSKSCTCHAPVSPQNPTPQNTPWHVFPSPCFDIRHGPLVRRSTVGWLPLI
jgi:hypothetical protein